MSETLPPLSETVTGRVVDKIFPGFIDVAAANDVELVEMKLSGSIRTTFLGIKTQSKDWTSLGALTDIAAGSRNPWAAKMMACPSMQVRKYGKTSLMSTSIDDNFMANNNRLVGHINLSELNVQTGPNEGNAITAAINGTAGTEMVMQNAVSGFDPAWPPPPYYSRLTAYYIPEANFDSLRNVVKNMGYEIDVSSPLLLGGPGFGQTHERQSVSFLQLCNIAEGKASDYYFASAIKEILRTMLQCHKPGMKYIPFIFHGHGSDKKASNDWSSTTFGAGFHVWAIPVLDDGNKDFIGYATNESNGQEFWIKYADTRYYDGAVGISPKIHYGAWARVAKLSEYTLPSGEVVPLTSVPTTGYREKLNQLGDNFLMYLMPPLDKQHYIISGYNQTSKQYDHNGTTVTVKEINVVVSLFATKIDKQWYSDYYRSGFGLYQPRDSNIQKNILDKWDALDLVELGICVDNAHLTIDPSIVDKTDVAIAYKRARKKACKDDDWDKQAYSSKMTNGQVKNLIIQNPTLNAFYSASTLTAEPSFNGPTLEKSVWSRKLIDTVVSYDRTEDDLVENYQINDTTRDIIIAEIGGGATLSSSMSDLVNDFGLTLEEQQALTEAVQEVNSGYLKENPSLTGYRMANQYFAPEVALSQSGYPVARYMVSPYKEQMIMRTYADLKRIGDPIFRIIQSFSGDVIIKKIVEKL